MAADRTVPSFELFQPTSVADAQKLLAHQGENRLDPRRRNGFVRLAQGPEIKPAQGGGRL